MKGFRLPDEQSLARLQADMKARLPVRIHLAEPQKALTSLEWKRDKGLAPLLKPARKRRQPTFEQQLLSRQLTQAQIPFEQEFRFHPKRRWRADFRVATLGSMRWSFIVEIVGGVWLPKGGHSRGKAQIDDMEKFNHAALLGYRVLQFTPEQVRNEKAIGFITNVLREDPHGPK